MINVRKAFELPESLRGKKINSEKIIPTVCNLKNMLRSLEDCNWKYSSLRQWEQTSYRHYNISKIQGLLMRASEEERIRVIREYILEEDFNSLGASPFDIYIVAYVSENIDASREEFIEYCLSKNMAGTRNSANAIYQVGKGDGVYLGILYEDGRVKDWDFMYRWVFRGTESERNDRRISVINQFDDEDSILDFDNGEFEEFLHGGRGSGRTTVEEKAAVVMRALGQPSYERTRDVFQIYYGDGDDQISVIITAENIEVRLPQIEWTCGSYGPVLTSRFWKSISFKELEARSEEDCKSIRELVENGVRARKRQYKKCKYCGEKFPPERMISSDVCHSCAEAHEGVLF